ncbi:MAG TPA: hypothetical protein VGH57_31635 [Amycolatopsis sp.]
MKDAANEGRGAMRAGRLASRALLVLGGAVAATAAAWAVSSATASADTGTAEAGGVSVTPVTDTTVANLGDVTHGVSSFTGDVAGAAVGAVNGVTACEQDATTWSEPGTSRPICPLDPRDHIGGPHTEQVRTTDHEVSGRVSDAVADLGQEAVLQPVRRTLGAAEHIARKPEDTRQVIEQTVTPSPETPDLGSKVWGLLDPNRHGKLIDLPALPASPVEPTPDSAATGTTGDPAQNLGAAAVSTPGALRAMFPLAGLAHTGAPADGLGDSSHHKDHHNLPPAPFSPGQLPMAPPSIPTAPGGGSTAPGGHLDVLNFGVPSWVSAAVDNAVAGSTRAGVRHTPLSPGEQPGVTPD